MRKYFIIMINFILLAFLLGGCNAATISEPGTHTSAAEHNHSFSYHGLTISMNAEASSILKELGEPQSYSEETSCAFDGLDKTYFFGDFYLTTYPSEGKDYVYSAWFINDLISTEEGISIGDSMADVEEIYGTDFFLQSNTCSIVKGDSKLKIIFTDDAVSSIQYEMVME